MKELLQLALLEPVESRIQLIELFAQQLDFMRLNQIGGEMRVSAPPVHADFFCLVDRTDQQPDLDGQQFDIREVDFDIARDDKTLVEDAIQYVYKSLRTMRA